MPIYISLNLFTADLQRNINNIPNNMLSAMLSGYLNIILIFRNLFYFFIALIKCATMVLFQLIFVALPILGYHLSASRNIIALCDATSSETFQFLFFRIRGLKMLQFASFMTAIYLLHRISRILHDNYFDYNCRPFSSCVAACLSLVFHERHLN